MKVATAKTHHDLAMNLLKVIFSGDTNEMVKSLLTFNKGMEEEICSKTICLIDATGSMHELLEKTKITVE